MSQTDRLSRALEGRYRILEELGAGGMAMVYLAEDLRHHRHVAVKVLREELGATVGAARFLREIDIAARLQHPHILPLLDSGEADGLLYYIMPYVEGRSLRDRLAREHELPVNEALRILAEVTDALAYAHEHGIVHRDIKPENVMLTGRHALVTDFGVARAISEASLASSRSTMTAAGVALGTPAYMSPEQASADPSVDQRSDLYSVGVLGYEMLSGQLPFTAPTPQQLLAAQVSESPVPLSVRRPRLDAGLAAAVMRCLEKRPADRWQRADALQAALESLATPAAGLAPATSSSHASVSRWHPAWLWAMVGAVVATGVVTTLSWRAAHDAQPSFTVGRSSQLTSDLGLQIFPDISPDGKLVAYASGSARRMRIYVQPVTGGRTVAISDDSTAVETDPRWSPDGTQVMFLSRGGVSVASALGEATRIVVPASPRGTVQTAAWSPDGQQIVFVRGDSIFIRPVAGGSPRVVGVGRLLSGCRWSPAGTWIACVEGNREAVRPGGDFGNIAPSSVVVVPVTGGALRPVTDSLVLHQSPAWSPDGGRLYFVSSQDGPRDVYEVSLARDGSARGAARRLTTGLNVQSISLARNAAALAYAVYTSRANIWALPLSSGTPVSLDRAVPVTSGAQTIESMRVSRDGRWLLYDSNLHGSANIYRIPVTGGQPEQLTQDPFDVFAPDLSPDGRLVAYHSWRTGTRDIEVKPLDGGPVEFVTATPAQESYPTWSPDGSQLAFYDQDGPSAIYISRRESSGVWSRPVRVGNGFRPEWSHNGQFLAYRSPDRISIRVRPVGPGAERVVYVASAQLPRADYAIWGADDRSLVFKSHDAMGRASFWAVPVEGGAPRLLASLSDLSRPSERVDFAMDARRLYFTLEDKQSNVWVAEIARR